MQATIASMRKKEKDSKAEIKQLEDDLSSLRNQLDIAQVSHRHRRDRPNHDELIPSVRRRSYRRGSMLHPSGRTPSLPVRRPTPTIGSTTSVFLPKVVAKVDEQLQLTIASLESEKGSRERECKVLKRKVIWVHSIPTVLPKKFDSDGC